MNKAWWFAIIPGVLSLAAVVFIVMLFLIKVLWGWVVPDLFPNAVEMNLVARNISWYTSLKLAVCFAVLSGIFGAFARHRS